MTKAAAPKRKKAESGTQVLPHSLFGELDVHLFREGNHHFLHRVLGSHCIELDGVAGVQFAVWAPNAERVEVIGDFNAWQGSAHALLPRWDGSGVWEGFVPKLSSGTVYKYRILSREAGQVLEKGDPFAFAWEHPPRTASVVWDLKHAWGDGEWMENRAKRQGLDSAISVYEVHAESWKRQVGDGFRPLTYAEMAVELVAYVKEMGFSHVEFMPLMEYPFGGSWGYQGVGYFAPTSRFGTPQDFMALVEAFHAAGIGVFLDWVPSHFPGDLHGLYRYDGTALFEHEDPRKGFHPDWKSYIFNYGRNEVRSFLISSAMFWLEQYHADGIRVDAVASMLYLDYSRKAGEWVPNQHGGRENLEAIAFLRSLNEAAYLHFPGIQMIAEESTSWPLVSRPTFLGGLGFGMKWMMGWMNDTLEYFKKDPIYRQHHQNELTFSINYAFTENFMLPLSHDEVVHGKGALIARMPGDEWQRFANLRLLYGLQWTHPGAKLLFMGCEFGQTREWDNDDSLHWDLLQFAPHKGVSNWVKALNATYKAQPALHELNFQAEGFQFIDHSDHAKSVLAFLRKGHHPQDDLIIIANMTPRIHEGYRFGAPAGDWKLVLNSDASEYHGSGYELPTHVAGQPIPWHGQAASIVINLPPLSLTLYCRA